MLPNNRENERRVSIKHIVSMPQLWAASVKTILLSVFNCDVNDGKVDGITGYIEDSVKILVCGAKNTGKSTLGRYVVNRLLSYHYVSKSCRAPSRTRSESGIERVAYMDTDIGQTEFTPPGFVSIFILDNSEPMLGPALPHWRKPLLSYFIGDVTPRSFPEMYLAAVKNLLARYTKLKLEGHSRIPLVINTMGWVKGMGLDLLNQIMQCRSLNIFFKLSETRRKTFFIKTAGILARQIGRRW